MMRMTSCVLWESGMMMAPCSSSCRRTFAFLEIERLSDRETFLP